MPEDPEMARDIVTALRVLARQRLAETMGEQAARLRLRCPTRITVDEAYAEYTLSDMETAEILVVVSADELAEIVGRYRALRENRRAALN